MAPEFTKDQRVIVRVCDEWLKEVGLPPYSELVKNIEQPADPRPVGEDIAQ